MRRVSAVLCVFCMLFLNGAFAQIQSDTSNVVADSLNIIIQQDSIIQNDDDKISKSSVLNYFFPKDSLDVYRYSFRPNDSINYTRFLYPDTSNHTSGEYEPLKKFNKSYINLGPVASAEQNQLFVPSSKQGFQYGIVAFDAYLWKEKELILYDNRSPYTKVFYLMGSKKENILKVSHAQSFLDQQITAQFDFQLFNHLGFYERQHTDAKSFKGGMGYATKNKRYLAHFQYYHNKIYLEENGGIQDLLDFEEDRETNRQIIPINLENADNLIRISGISVNQEFFLSKPEPDLSEIPDTNLIEYDAYSVIHYKKPWFAPVSHLGKISYYFNYQRENYKYTDRDQNSEIYDSVPFWSEENNVIEKYTLPYFPTPDSSSIFDSITIRKYTNEIIYSNSDYKDEAGKPKFLNYFAGFRNELSYFNQACFSEKDLMHQALIGGVFVHISSFLSLAGDASYYLGDYLNNDFQLNAKLYLRIKSNQINGGIQIIHRSPDYIFQDFNSSRLRWSNNFGKTDQQLLYLNFDRKNLWFSAKIMNITNYLYFNELYQPVQEGENIQHISIEGRKDFRFGNWGADIRLSYQKVSNKDVIRVPDFTAKSRLYYHNIFFNNVLDMEIGVQAFYFTAYYADRYLPLLRSYHIQNVQSIGNYPFLDVYFNAKIGRARLFVRYDNFNANFMKNNYYASPSYPGLDPMFRFGIDWVLFN